MTSTTSTHALQFDAPTWGDYLKGGYGDLVAQCSCGQYEYVSSRNEGLYWHWLHRTNKSARAGALLRILVNNPMPEGWIEPHLTLVPSVPAATKVGRYTCPECMGKGTVLAAGGFGGHFYSYGTSTRVSCSGCSGSGRTELWVA